VNVVVYKDEYRLFKPVEITLRWKGKNWSDEPVWDIIHTYMEMSQ
jgi:hypothetical protein